MHSERGHVERDVEDSRMKVKMEGWIYIAITALVLQNTGPDLLGLVVRLCALYGLAALAISTAMTPFVREITQAFGRPFLTIHQTFAIVGLIFITFHPVFFAISAMDILVFIPRFDSWLVFWELAGRPALYIAYFAASAALLRRKIPKYWRSIHALMYIVLFFAIVHGNLIGTDFQNPVLMIIYNVLFAITILTFILRRYQIYQRKKLRKVGDIPI
jgi:DMSO/TMAO reductase YedYZ heme-binding membrane subunit